jgi:UDP-2,4-diacetamido-2,4,6-trideoxy-beta-L-altropyranose hydrolase
MLHSFSPNELEVKILTEGDSVHGFGHVMRCISLFQAFAKNNITPLIIVDGDEHVNNILSAFPKKKINWLSGKNGLFDEINNTDILIIDSLRIDEQLLLELYNASKFIVIIDDFIRRNYTSGCVIDWTILSETMPCYSHLNKDVIYLLGSKYVSLRQPFWNVDKKKLNDAIQTVLITFGGGDLRNIMPEVLNLLVNNFPNINKKVIIGNGFTQVHNIEKAADQKTKLIYHPDAEAMKKAMLDSDVAISAGGQTLYELARVGLPTIALTVIDNQKYDIDGWQKVGFIDNAGWWDHEKTYENIVELLTGSSLEKRTVKSRIGQEFVDGHGADRIVSKVVTYITKEI